MTMDDLMQRARRNADGDWQVLLKKPRWFRTPVEFCKPGQAKQQSVSMHNRCIFSLVNFSNSFVHRSTPNT